MGADTVPLYEARRCKSEARPVDLQPGRDAAVRAPQCVSIEDARMNGPSEALEVEDADGKPEARGSKCYIIFSDLTYRINRDSSGLSVLAGRSAGRQCLKLLV